MVQQLPAIDGIDDASDIRVVLYQQLRLVHAPALELGLQPLDDKLTAFAASGNTTGFLAQIAANSFAWRTLTGTANKITVANGNGASGNPTITIPDAVTLVTPTVTGTLILTGGAIAFPATQIDDGGANVLDDYEQGTFTPGMTFGGSAAGVTFSTQTGHYTKVGNLANIWEQMTLSSNGSGTGTALGTNLPFTPSGAINFACAVQPLSGFSGLTAGVSANFTAGGTTINLRGPNTTGSAVLTDTEITNTANFYLGGSFHT
jgi:hypothetical protein